MLLIANKQHPPRKARHWRTRIDWVQSLVDIGIVSFTYINSVNNTSDIGTKILPKYTFDALARMVTGADHKYLKGTHIDLRLARKLHEAGEDLSKLSAYTETARE